MKRLVIASILAIILVGGLGLYSLKVLGDVQKRTHELDDAFETRARELRETDGLFPHVPGPHLDPVRFGTWLEIRTEVARVVAPAGSALEQRQRENAALGVLRAELVKRKMGLAEYRAISARYGALLGLPEFAELRRGRAQAPATDAQEKEIEQIRRYARQLGESIDAELLDPVLDRVGGGAGEGKR